MSKDGALRVKLESVLVLTRGQWMVGTGQKTYTWRGLSPRRMCELSVQGSEWRQWSLITVAVEVTNAPTRPMYWRKGKLPVKFAACLVGVGGSFAARPADGTAVHDAQYRAE